MIGLCFSALEIISSIPYLTTFYLFSCLWVFCMHVCLGNLLMHCPPWTEEDIIWAVRLSGVTDGHDVGASNQTATFSKIR